MTNPNCSKKTAIRTKSGEDKKNQNKNNIESQLKKLQNNDLLLGNQMNELLSQIKLMQEHLFPQIKENQIESANYKRICQIIDKFEQSHLDFTSDEIELSQMYNELLQYPFLLRKIEITQHHRILNKALELNYQTFDHQKFIEFIYESITKYEKYEIQSLLVYFDETSFSECFNYIEQLKANPHFVFDYLTYRNDRYMNLFDRLFKEDHHIQAVHKQYEEVLNTLQKNQNEMKSILIQQSNQFKELQNEHQQYKVSIERSQTNCYNELTNEIHRLQTKVESLELSNEELKKQNSKLCKDFNQQFKQIDQRIQTQHKESNEVVKTNVDSLKLAHEELKKQNSKLSEDFNQQIKQIDQRIQTQHKELNEVMKTNVDSLKLSNEELKKQNSKLCKDFNEQIKQIDQRIQTQHKESIEPMRNEIKTISTNTKHLSKLTELQQNQTNTLNIIQQIKNNYPDKFPFVSIYQFDGILNNLKNRGRVRLISGHAEDGEQYKITNLLDYSNANETRYYAEADSKTNYFECHFLKTKIDLSSYQIKSGPNSPNFAHPKTWEIKGSNDQKQWDILDRRENYSDLNRKCIIKHFICQQPTHKKYQFIRFYVFDTWHSNKQYQYTIWLSRFELYSDIYST